MKIALVSDLHLEFCPIKLPETGADILLLAGDIVPICYLAEKRTDADARKVQKRMDYFVAESLGQYSKVYHVLGNHEYYHGIWETAVDEFKEYWSKKAPQVKVLNNEALQLEGFRLWGGTLWTSLSEGHSVIMSAAKYGLNDYNFIKHIAKGMYRDRLRITPEDTLAAYETAKYTLKEDIEKYPEDRWVIMTHHAPSWGSVLDKYKKDPLSYCFASHLDKFIEDHPQIRTWAHGHMHNNFDYNIGETRVICNPRGYANPNNPNRQENVDFNPTFTFDIMK